MQIPKPRLAAVLEGFGTSILIAAPCLWLPRIVSADYPSHLYNAWFLHDLRANPVPGLEVTQPRTNILGDLLLQLLSDDKGVVQYEFALPLIAVLTFFWGAFFWLRRASGDLPRAVAPLLAMLAYGAVFQLGFLNHYLSLGLSLWLLGLLWSPSILTVCCAALIAPLTWIAHPIPLIWAGAVLTFRFLHRMTPMALQGWWLLASLLVVASAGEFLDSTLPSRRVWEVASPPEILLGLFGADQVWIYGLKYAILAILLAVFLVTSKWTSLGDAKGPVRSNFGLQLWLAHAAAVVAIPATLQFPGYEHVLAFIPQRLSLFAGLVLCLALTGREGRRIFLMTVSLAITYFAFLFMDGAAYNRVQAEVTQMVHTVPAGARVVGPIYDSGARIPALVHAIDRACIGWCYSFGNYEPATGQFVLQATGDNPRVAWPMSAVQAIEAGEFVVPETIAPLYAVCACETQTAGQKLCLRKLTAGEKTCTTTLEITRRWGPF